MVPEARPEGPSLREVPGFGRMAPSPRSATNRPQACLLNAPRAHASSARKGGGLNPLERSLACMVPEARLEGPSLREVPGFGRMAPSPRSATNRPQACLLNAPRAHASSARKGGGLNPLERSLACMVPEARLELARCCQRWILSPLRLPIPPLGHVMRELVYHSLLSISPKMELRAFRRVRPNEASRAHDIHGH